jgi:hypothetical protein
MFEGNLMSDDDHQSFPAETQIKACATKLRRNRVFRNLVLVHVAIAINQQRISKLSLGTDEPLDLLSLYKKTEKLGALQPEALNKLEAVFKKNLRSGALWEEAASWLLTRLAAWAQDNQLYTDYAIPDVLAIPPDPKRPGEDSWMEARLLSILTAQIATQLLRQLDFANSSVEALENFLGVSQSPTKSSPESPPPLFNGRESEKFALGYPIDDSKQISSNTWKDGDYSFWRKLVGDSFIEHQIICQNPETKWIELVPSKAAWESIQQLGPEATHMLLIFATSATDSTPPWKNQIQLKGTELVKLLGWDNRTDLTLDSKFKRIGSLVQLICGLSISISILDLEQQTYTISTSPLWLLEGLEYSGNLTLTSNNYPTEATKFEAKDPNELVIQISPGSWIEKFLPDQDVAAREKLQQYGYLAKSTLQINLYHKRLAAKLAIFLTVMSRMHPNGRYRIATLLEALESQEFIEAIQQDSDQQNLLIEEWDDALLILTQLGWEIRFDPRTYPRALQPNWSQTEGSPTHKQIRPKEWLTQWLNAHLAITPTTLIQHRLAVSQAFSTGQTGFNYASGNSGEMLQTPTVIPGYALEMALAAKGLSKAKLAEQLNLDRSMVTHWIKGSRPIQPSHREKLWQLLGRELQQVTGIRG